MKNGEPLLWIAAVVGVGLAWSGWNTRLANVAEVAMVALVSSTFISYFASKRCALVGLLVGAPVAVVGLFIGQIGSLVMLVVSLFGALVGYGLVRTWRDNDGTPA